MRTLHLTLMIFGQVLLASFILYSAVVSASPLNPPISAPVQAAKPASQVVVVQAVHKEPEVKLSPSLPAVAATAQIVQSEKTISARCLKKPTVATGKSEDVAVAVQKEQVVVPKHSPVAPKEPEVKVADSKLEARSASVEPVVQVIKQEPHYHVSSSATGFERVNKPAAVPEVHVHQDVVEPRSGHVVVVPVVPEIVESKPIAPQLAPVPEPKQVVEVYEVKPRLRNLPDAEAVRSSEVVVKPKDEVKVVLEAKSVPKMQEVVAKESFSKETGKDEKETAEKVYKEMVGKSRVVMEQQIAPAVVPEQVQQTKVAEVAPHQAPVAQVEKVVVPEPVVGVVEPVKRAEPVSASVMLVVQSPAEPKMTVVSKVAEYHQPQEQQQAPPAQVQHQQVAATSVVTKIVEPEASPVASASANSPPIVNGGLGPLHLLATTLCSYQPDKPVADDTLNQLYGQRAAVRKSLFDFMSLKFTNLEKFSSRLNAGLEIMPRKTTDPGVVPSHGWPVVGKCTAHDLKLMAEAAWCETPANPSSTEALDKETPKITSNHHHLNRVQAARALAEDQADQSAVISKILHVSEIKDSPIVETSQLANLNLTQQQLADIQAQATSTRVCRRNALKLTKALFNHLAEEQRNVSDSWPQLYTQMSGDDCARKRMIDIVNALSSFRTDSTSIRRDNVEFAFAMDDLRSKVLDQEVNVPLTFDKQFIEVEQFLQQSVKLMLANIDPERAKLTSMRYRSLMPGPLSADDQCIELHQRLLAKNYPTDCNPTQFGQLPDVLRMAASSLELWSIENELSKRSGKAPAEYPSASSQTAVRQDVNQCIANLVAS